VQLQPTLVIDLDKHLIIDESTENLGNVIVKGRLSLKPSGANQDVVLQLASLTILGGRFDVDI